MAESCLGRALSNFDTFHRIWQHTIVIKRHSVQRGYFDMSSENIVTFVHRNLPSFLRVFFFREHILCSFATRGWAETKPKVWFRSRNFGFWIKLSVSVGFGFCKTARFWRQTVKTAKKKAERFFFLHLFQKVKAKYWIPLSELKVRFCFHFLK